MIQYDKREGGSSIVCIILYTIQKSMDIPKLSVDDVENIILGCKVCGEPMKGGQKIVFPCIISGKKCALKFILIGKTVENDQSGDTKELYEAVEARVLRELSIMKRCSSNNMVKLGDIELTRIEWENQILLYYSEEWVEGENLKSIIKRDKNLNYTEVIRMGIDISQAIESLWEIKNIHRDIKPQNIMRKSTGEYILLDLGLAFDLQDKSLTQFGCIPGTKMYLSPEQLDYLHKRDLDFRSDLFSLGVVMYEAVTGQHPFYGSRMLDEEIFFNIQNKQPRLPKDLVQNIPDKLNDIILRLLCKSPSGRYRKCEFLISKLEEI